MKNENSKPATDVGRQAKKTGSRAILTALCGTESAWKVAQRCIVRLCAEQCICTDAETLAGVADVELNELENALPAMIIAGIIVRNDDGELALSARAEDAFFASIRAPIKPWRYNDWDGASEEETAEFVRRMTQGAAERNKRPSWLEFAVCAVAVATVAIATTLSLTAGF